MTGEKPPKLLCPLCEFDIDHRHHGDEPPVVGCRPCFVGLHEMCDPLSYWCSCSHEECRERMT